MDIRAEGVCREYIRKSGDANVFTAVEETDLVLPAGQLCVLKGRSGSGKTTLMNMLAGLLKPTKGRVFAELETGEVNISGSAWGDTTGQDVSVDLYEMSDEELSKFRAVHFGYIPQGASAIKSLTVKENIYLPFTMYGEKVEDDEYGKELMELLGISQLSESRPDALSGGELRRVAIARALISRPDVVFADEPTGDLDDENTEIVLSLLKKTAKDGAAVLLVTHEDSASEYADQCWQMSAGRVKIN